MGIIAELTFLKNDARFKPALNAEDQKMLEWFLEFDRHIRTLLKETFELLNEGVSYRVHEQLQELEDAAGREIRFLGRIRGFAQSNNLKIEEKMLRDAMLRVNKTARIFHQTGFFLGAGKVSEAKRELETIFSLL